MGRRLRRAAGTTIVVVGGAATGQQYRTARALARATTQMTNAAMPAKATQKMVALGVDPTPPLLAASFSHRTPDHPASHRQYWPADPASFMHTPPFSQPTGNWLA